MPKSETARIAELNDLARTAMGIASRLIVTPGVVSLGDAAMSSVRERVEQYNDFTDANDPHGERDFGSFKLDGETIFWKIDYYNRSLTGGSEDPADPKQTTRVLTIMLATEY